MSENLTAYQGLLHRMVYQKLQWLDYYGDREVPAARDACHTFADLVVQTQADCPESYLVNLHDACLALCLSTGRVGAFGETLGRLFNNAREIYIAQFYGDPIRVLPSDHPRFDWEKRADPPQNPSAIDVRALTEPLPPPTQALPRADPPPRWVMPATLSAVFSLAVLFIVIGLAQ